MANSSRTAPVSFESQGMTLQGLADCTRRLMDVPEKIRKRILRKAIEAGGNPLVREARKAAPKDAGNLRRSLDKKVLVYSGGTVAIAIVGQRKHYNSVRRKRGHGGISRTGAAVPIHLVELPTRPHRIPKVYKKIQVKTTKEYRDAQRRLGMNFRQYRIEASKPLVMRLPGGRQVIVEAINHPGTKGKFVIERTAAAASAAAADRFAAKMAVEMDREILALKVLGWTEGY